MAGAVAAAVRAAEDTAAVRVISLAARKIRMMLNDISIEDSLLALSIDASLGWRRR